MKKVLLTAALLAAPTVGFSKGVIQLDVSGFSYGSSAQTFDTDDVTATNLSEVTKKLQLRMVLQMLKSKLVLSMRRCSSDLL